MTRFRRSMLGVPALLASVVMTLVPTQAARAEPTGQILATGNPNVIPDSYMVVFEKNAVSTASTLAAKYQVNVEHVYQHALQGFAGTMNRETAQKLADEPGVAYVEQNGMVRASDTQPDPPSWGLDRIDQRSLPLDSSFTYPSTGSKVRAYIIDTGMRITHTTFGGRAIWGTNTTGDGNDSDCNGHGTHVGGTVGGAQYGVAKAVALTAVKVLDCFGSGTLAGVAAGVDWVTGNHTAGAPAVANMSLGAVGTSATLENAVRASIADGIVYVLASGNNYGADACGVTPARVVEAITVNASTRSDARASFSNIGLCTDIFAPGQDITSAWNTSNTATNTKSGTSMAAPHVAGAAALILSADPSLTPVRVSATIFARATTDVITDAGIGSPHWLLYDNQSFAPLEYWTIGPYFGSRGTSFADVTGDGRADAIAVNGDTVTVRSSTGTIFGFGAPEDWTHGPYFGSRGTSFTDVTGDRRADAIAINDDTVTVRRSISTSFGPTEDWIHGAYIGALGTLFADVTGDGRADAIVVNRDVLTVRRSTGTRFGVYEDWTSEPFFGSVGTFFADVTGDRRADAIVVNYDRIVVRRSV